MTPRVALSVAVGAVFALGLTLAALVPGAAQPARIAFQIGTGSTGGTYFVVGERLAGLLSHPPGAQRCEKSKVCGPAGLIVSARSSEGAVANIRAVNIGAATSAFAQSDAVALAVAGKGPFRKEGPRRHVRVIAALFPEDVHLVVAPAAKIGSVTALKKKRVGLGAENSGTLVTARAILSAWRVREKSLKASFDPPEIAAQKLAQGEIDAFFFVGGAPVPLIRHLIETRKATLVPLADKYRARLLKETPGLSADTIPAGVYPGLNKVETVKSDAVWIVNDAQPDDLIYAMTRALFAPENLKALAETSPAAAAISLDRAAADPPAPLHPGAERFYRDIRKLPDKNQGKAKSKEGTLR